MSSSCRPACASTISGVCATGSRCSPRCRACCGSWAGTRNKERGLLGYTLLTGSPRTYYVVQYWESKEKLYAYAAAPDTFHRTAWAMTNRKERKSRQYVGRWHETYIVPEGGYESVHADMPAYGLATATGVLPVEGRGRRAADRLAHRSSRK